MSESTIGILQKRRIEAEIIKPIYDILKRELGFEKAQEIIGEAIIQSAIHDGKKMADAEPDGSSLESFIGIQPLWLKDNALEIDIVKQDSQQYEFNVQRCRYAEMYQELGLGEIGHLLSCNRDGSFIEGYAPQLEFERSQTIMDGAKYCDFRYRATKSK